MSVSLLKPIVHLYYPLPPQVSSEKPNSRGNVGFTFRGVPRVGDKPRPAWCLSWWLALAKQIGLGAAPCPPGTLEGWESFASPPASRRPRVAVTVTASALAGLCHAGWEDAAAKDVMSTVHLASRRGRCHGSADLPERTGWLGEANRADGSHRSYGGRMLTPRQMGGRMEQETAARMQGHAQAPRPLSLSLSASSPLPLPLPELKAGETPRIQFGVSCLMQAFGERISEMQETRNFFCFLCLKSHDKFIHRNERYTEIKAAEGDMLILGRSAGNGHPET
ncbi:uncharacterized protein LOC119542948 [Choloepus didactylus]|uniref:uncharacterized protein LOC119542948 n=1 Tax=Choloepus didactylus TaxID=27675 RepID=UPI00189F64AE|nr:uncharacterized protein LOC119542948 [Choloepus didactylus]